MALTLQQYVEQLDSRDLTWPMAPPPKKAKAKAHLARLPQIQLVTWNIYGTLLGISGGELYFEHPDKFMMDLALEKTVQEFKMWGSMSRKPGQPSEYMGQIYKRVYDDLRLAPSPGEKHPEMHTDRIWEAILKKLMQKEYKYDAATYGSLNDYGRKIAYFFHASLQGTACYPEAATALEHVKMSGLRQGLIADAQCFTLIQLERGLAQQHCATPLGMLFDADLRSLSFEHNARKPSERLFRPVLQAAAAKGIAPVQILHIGSRIEHDLAPAKKLGMRTGLFAGDKESLRVTGEQLKDPATRPDVLLTDLGQIREIVGA